eukprot:11208247-Lingulodinium_polyedra.AAC.1
MASRPTSAITRGCPAVLVAEDVCQHWVKSPIAGQPGVLAGRVVVSDSESIAVWAGRRRRLIGCGAVIDCAVQKL